MKSGWIIPEFDLVWLNSNWSVQNIIVSKQTDLGLNHTGQIIYYFSDIVVVTDKWLLSTLEMQSLDASFIYE